MNTLYLKIGGAKIEIIYYYSNRLVKRYWIFFL